LLSGSPVIVLNICLIFFTSVHILYSLTLQNLLYIEMILVVFIVWSAWYYWS